LSLVSVTLCQIQPLHNLNFWWKFFFP
jgi:hypothetical protein